MEFWDTFFDVWQKLWQFADTPMTFGGFSISFSDILLATGICSVLTKCVYDIIYESR